MIIGRLGRDPEIKYAQSGTAICNLSVATSETWNDKNTGQKQEKTEWHRAVAFGKQAEILERYLKKGDQVYLEGQLQTRSYDKDGQTHYATEIVVRNFTFLGGGQEQRQQPASQPEQKFDDSDSIPF
jgi:single-strand DNA-binding protein